MATFETFAVGHDFGNSEICSKVIGPAGRTFRRIPSVTSNGSWRQVEASARGIGKQVRDIMQADHYVLEYETDTPDGMRQIGKFVGQKVFDDGGSPFYSRGDSNRYWMNNYNIEALMVSTAAQIPANEYSVYVVTGLPIAVYLDDPANADRVTEQLDGTHEFSLNGVDKVMHVKSKCIMEGAGALIAYGNSGDDLQGVIDIGGHTTDLFVAKGQKPQASRCKGFAGGVAAAADRFVTAFREEYNYSVSATTAHQLIRQHIEHQPYQRVYINQQREVIDRETLSTMLEQALRDTGEQIATEIATRWNEFKWELQDILIVGGGAHYFAKDIQARFPIARVPRDPEMANAEGYAKLAEGMMYRARVQAMQSRSA